MLVSDPVTNIDDETPLRYDPIMLSAERVIITRRPLSLHKFSLHRFGLLRYFRVPDLFVSPSMPPQSIRHTLYPLISQRSTMNRTVPRRRPDRNWYARFPSPHGWNINAIVERVCTPCRKKVTCGADFLQRGVVGGSSEILARKLRPSVARCIITERETSVIYHKLCELLAQKLHSAN